jgi:RHS repeat-associated protein
MSIPNIQKQYRAGQSGGAGAPHFRRRTGTTEMTYDAEWTTITEITDPANKTRRQQVDVLGRLIEVVEDPTGLNYSTKYVYDALDNLTEVLQGNAVNPAGNQMRKFYYSSLGRLTEAYNPESGMTYYTYYDSGDLRRNVTAHTADGRITGMHLGNGLYDTRSYNTPGTATVYKLGTVSGGNDRTEIKYHFSAQKNNGNVIKQEIRRKNVATSTTASWTQNYEYDGVNRLKKASETSGWSRTYGYDNFGNRHVSASSGLAFTDLLEPTQASDFDETNNRLTMSEVNYDDAGNQTEYGDTTLEYDAEGRNTKVTGPAGFVTFAYDGEGRRVKKVSGGLTTYFVYNALEQLAVEYSNEAQPATSGTSYLFTDMLGSVRTITDGSGNVTECYDYLPFGRILSASDNGRSVIKNASGQNCHPATPDTWITSSVDEKFTGQKRDPETGLDYFGARYMSAPQGRFMSPDKPLLDQHIGDPQSWNLYAYARNNPLLYVDPTGEMIELLGDEEELKKALEYFQKIAGNLGSQLTIVKDKKRNFLEIAGNVDDFRNSSKIANDLYNLIDQKEIIEFGITDRDLSEPGGAQIFAPGKDGNNENVRILVNPNQTHIGDRKLRSTPIGSRKFEGYRETPPWNARRLTTETSAWHEFGHASGYIPGQKDWSKTNKEAVDWENRMREQLYGPLGPNNAPRRIH